MSKFFAVSSLVISLIGAHHPLTSAPDHVDTLFHEGGFSLRLKRKVKKKLPAFKKRLQAGADTRVLQRNVDNIEYIGPLYMGSSMEKVEVVWDTGSDWLVVNSANCRTCTEDGYDPKTSTKFKQLPNSYYEQEYLSAFVSGNKALDSVCLTTSATSCAEKFKWLLVKY